MKSTEQITEALKELMLELEPASPAMKKYRKYLQRQNTDDDDITTTKLIEKVHLDDLDLYVITFAVLATSVLL